MAPRILTATDDRGVVTVTLADPATRNALGVAALRELDGLLAGAFADAGVRAVCLTGDGTTFCSGADRSDLADPQSLAASTELLTSVLVRIDEAPVPVVCRVNGPAFGAGVAVIAAADIGIAAEEAFFAVPEVRFGLVAGPAIAACARRLDVSGALDVFVTGRRFDAREAGRLRLVTEVVERDALDARVARCLDEVLLGERDAIRRTRKAVRELSGPALAARMKAVGGFGP